MSKLKTFIKLYKLPEKTEGIAMPLYYIKAISLLIVKIAGTILLLDIAIFIIACLVSLLAKTILSGNNDILYLTEARVNFHIYILFISIGVIILATFFYNHYWHWYESVVEEFKKNGEFIPFNRITEYFDKFGRMIRKHKEAFLPLGFLILFGLLTGFIIALIYYAIRHSGLGEISKDILSGTAILFVPIIVGFILFKAYEYLSDTLEYRKINKENEKEETERKMKEDLFKTDIVGKWELNFFLRNANGVLDKAGKKEVNIRINGNNELTIDYNNLIFEKFNGCVHRATSSINQNTDEKYILEITMLSQDIFSGKWFEYTLTPYGIYDYSVRKSVSGKRIVTD